VILPPLVFPADLDTQQTHNTKLTRVSFKVSLYLQIDSVFEVLWVMNSWLKYVGTLSETRLRRRKIGENYSNRTEKSNTSMQL
jgi:hypothetical protein